MKTLLITLCLCVPVLGFSQIRLKPNNKIVSFIGGLKLERTYAITIGHTVYLNCNVENFFADTVWMIHEFNHVRQWERFGTVGFLTRYLFLSIRGYNKNPMELQLKQKYQ
jgi:hypothetical protein